MLGPNAGKYVALSPDLHPKTPRNGAAALIQGTIYVVSSDKPYYVKLGKGDRAWSNFAATPFKIKLPFFATVSGVGNKQDGFYIFDSTGSAVYKPADDAWTSLPLMSSAGSNLRNMGATAVLGSKVYCIGGWDRESNSGTSAEVDVFDTTKREWTQTTPMPEKRALHAAAAYNGKVYVFGGTQDNPGGYLGRVGGAMNSVVAFDTSSEKWSSATAMPDAWHTMGTGPLPVFAGGKILLPEALVCGEICGAYAAPVGQKIGSLQYDAMDDSWEVVTSPTPYNRKSGGSALVIFGAFDRGI